jgi:lysophospholipase L1-like esterase
MEAKAALAGRIEGREVALEPVAQDRYDRMVAVVYLGDENVDAWLTRLNPEVAVIMFGSNDVGQMDANEYEQKTREVVQRSLKNGTVVLLTTAPPRSGRVEKSKQFADAVRKIAREEKLPLIDYFGEILTRRPDDWDGSLPQFKASPGDEYQVLTLIARDGVHPSNPKQH